MHLSHPPPLSQEQVAEALASTDPLTDGLSVKRTAGVLFLIQLVPRMPGQPFLLLNKRSRQVRQPGDLCCPGGRVRGRLDGFLGRLLRLPGSPLVRSPGWKAGVKNGRMWMQHVSQYWACCLRESWEEMGLRPWGVTFLGLLPVYRLALFTRDILPMVGWISGHRRFRLNWEVERLVSLSFSALLNRANYGVYVLEAHGPQPSSWDPGPNHFPCFLHRDTLGTEVLWGATYHIVESFLARVFGFKPPSMQMQQVVRGVLSRSYLTGERARD